MNAEAEGTTGSMTVVGVEVEGFVTDKVECNTYGDRFFQVKGKGGGEQLFSIDIVESYFEAGGVYQINSSNQSSAFYRDVKGNYLNEFLGFIKFFDLDYQSGEVRVEFEFTAKNSDGDKKDVRGKGDFKGITPKHRREETGR